MSDSPFTDEELGLLYRHGTRGFIYNAERAAQKATIEEWKADGEKHEALSTFSETFDMSYITLDISIAGAPTDPLEPGLEFNEGMFRATEQAPLDGPGMRLKRIGDELAQDVAENFEGELTRLLENSTLSKQQFLVFALLWEEPREHGAGRQLGEHGTAEALDIAIGTVRSHHARAKEKIEKAEFTAGLTDYAVMDIDTASEDTKTLLDEKLTQ